VNIEDLPSQLAQAQETIRALQEELAESNRGLVALALELEQRVDERTAALRVSEERYRNLFNTIDEGFCIIEMIFDAEGRPADYRFLEVNAAFEKQTGLHEAEGKLMRQLAPDHEAHWFEIYGKIALTGEPARFENDAKALNRYYDVYAYRVGKPEDRQVAILFNDISAHKRAEAEARRLLDTVQQERDRISSLVNSISDEVWFADTNKQFTLANPSALREFDLDSAHGIDVEQLVASLEVFRPDGSPRPVEEAPPLRALQGETVRDEEEMIRTPVNGELRYRQVSSAPVRDAGGVIIGSVSVVRDITERKKADEALREANEQLLEADRRKDEFLAMLAHELRNPLTPVRYAVQIMNAYCGAECASHTRTAHQRDIIERQIGHMARLIDDLLDVARITRGKIELRKDMIDLVSAVRHSIDSCHQALEQKHQELIESLPDEPLWLEGDQTRLEQIFANLLINAVKYSPSGRCIRVSVNLETTAGDGPTAVVRLRDEGFGISAELLPHVFELFTQGERGLDRAQGGLGIGLTMVRSLVQMHGGTVEAFSAGLDQGSEFIVRLPLIVETEPEVAKPSEAAPDTTGASLKILAVDDLADTAQSLAELLELWGHQARVAFDGTSALEAARIWRPEVILLDLGMPGMDGYEVARRLRAEHGRNAVVLIALTGYGQETARERAQEAEFDGYLTKPVDMAALRALLAGLAKRST